LPDFSNLQTRRGNTASDAGAQRSRAERGDEAAPQPHHCAARAPSRHGAGQDGATDAKQMISPGNVHKKDDHKSVDLSKVDLLYILA